MKHFMRFNHNTTFCFGLSLSILTLLTSCAPKYGCYYGMTKTDSPTTEICTHETTDQSITSVTNSE